MSYRHLGRQKLYTIVGIMVLCAAFVTSAGASGRHHHRYVRHSYSVRQSNVIQQSNTNTFNVAARGGDAMATCSNSGSPTGTATGAAGVAIAANVNFCPVNTATGGTAAAVNTGVITQTGTNMATATNTSTISR